MAIVELQSVSKLYGAVKAVDDVSLRIAQGEFVAFLGPSGCGKTTTLNLLAGFQTPSSGEILIDGSPVTNTVPHKRNMGVVFQSYALFPHLSVQDNIGFGLKMRKLNAGDRASRVRRALDLVRLQGLESRFPRELSGGQQQRVALARALVIEPSVLLLDEPLSNLDATLREEMRFEIREIQRRIGITTVFVTHDQAEAMAAADRLIIMKSGRIRQMGSARDIYQNPIDEFVATFLGRANLIPGTVKGREQDRVILDVHGTQVAVTSVAAVAEGSQAVILVRPEDMDISKDRPAGKSSISGKIENATYLGSSQHVSVKVGDQLLSAILSARIELPVVGEDIWMSWSPDASSMLRRECSAGH